MNKIASKYRAGWSNGKFTINEVGGKDDGNSYIWMISDVGESGIKGYVGGVGNAREGPHWDIKYVGFVGVLGKYGYVGTNSLVGEIG